MSNWSEHGGSFVHIKENVYSHVAIQTIISLHVHDIEFRKSMTCEQTRHLFDYTVNSLYTVANLPSKWNIVYN